MFTPEEISDKLKELPGWVFKDDKLEKLFEFKDFREAMEFVNKVADLAENANHHPEIEIDYNKVELELTSHDSGGVTEKDLELAQSIERTK